jgi:hypothetical protein
MPIFTGYVEVNNHALSNVGCYTVGGQPFFGYACIFAANLAWDSSQNKPTLYLNPQVNQLLTNTNQVAKLQAQGIKVLLSVLNNHDQAGWSCFTSEAEADGFAQELASCINYFGLDGVDIDDEYSDGAPNETSLIMVTSAMMAAMPGKVISKALFQDIDYFRVSWQGRSLAQNLNFGWEMSYWNTDGPSRLAPYVAAGMAPSQLAAGVSMDMNSPEQAAELASAMEENGFGGVMVFGVDTNADAMLSAISNVYVGAPTTVIPGCLASVRPRPKKGLERRHR